MLRPILLSLAVCLAAQALERPAANADQEGAEPQQVAQAKGLDVADVLELSVPAVKSRLHRSRLYLRDRLSLLFGERKPAGGRRRGGES